MNGTSTTQGAFRARLALAGLILCIFAVWMVQHPYLGIASNDSSLYSLLALARLHPESLSGDVFLRFGSQDHYTVFSPIFASAIRLMDLEPAAAVLTVAGQIAFFGCAWLLARCAMPARSALLAVGLLVALPTTYGVGNMFSYVESFLTPRQLAEALVLASLAATVARRNVLAGVCLLAATLIHPIMTVAGIVMLACMYVAIPRPRLALASAAALLLASLVPVLIIPTAPLAPFDATWLKLVSDETPYLFISQWPVENWGRVAVAAAALAVGAITSTTPLVVRLCRAALITAMCSVVVTLIYCDLLQSVLFTQMQPWRWLWLVEVIAVVLLPVIVRDCWQTGLLGRTATVLLVTTWALRDSPVTIFIAFLAVASVMAAGRLTQPRTARWVFLGACALFIMAMAINLAPKFSYVALNKPCVVSAAEIVFQRLSVWAGDGLFYAAVLAGCCWIVERRSSLGSAISLAAAAALACVLLWPPACQSWTAFHYTRELRAAFAQWRDEVPPRSEVIWPGTPVGAWYLLERPSYYSIHQVAGDIFSRAKALEIHRRAESIQSALETSSPTPPQHYGTTEQRLALPVNADKLDKPGLATACGDPALDFVVSWSRLGPARGEPVVPNRNKPQNRLYLYHCADLRS